MTNETFCPESHPELAFSRSWYGNDIGCDCLGIGEYSSGYNIEGNGDMIRQGGSCTGNQTLAGCRTAEANSAKIMG